MFFPDCWIHTWHTHAAFLFRLETRTPVTSCRARELPFIASAGCCCGDSIRRVKEKGSSTIVNGSLQPVPFTHSHKAFNNPFCPNEITSLVSFPSHRATRHISSHLRFLSLVLSSTLWCSFFICLHSFSLSLSLRCHPASVCVCVYVGFESVPGLSD